MSRIDIKRLVSKAAHYFFLHLTPRFKVSRLWRLYSADVKQFPEINQTGTPQDIYIPEFKTLVGKVTFKTKGVVQFIILTWSGHVAHDAWDTPKLDMVRDFVSFLLCTIADLKLEFGMILRWTNPWVSVVVLGLDTFDLFQKFLTFFTTLWFAHHYFNTFPKDAMTSSLSISIMLKNDLREFKEEFLAEALFVATTCLEFWRPLRPKPTRPVTLPKLECQKMGGGAFSWREIRLSWLHLPSSRHSIGSTLGRRQFKSMVESGALKPRRK